MTDNPRDTKFLGFAKLLYVSIYQRIEHDYGPMHHLIPKVQEAVERIIAQRAYDLVYHTLANTSQAMAAYCEHRPDIPENVLAIPDLTQWPDLQDCE